ncbi:odorant receptor 22c-like isoform X2 [Ooceraea biroi]|uniref:odorant receptor 22c-like isoform X2 n=1 Tax=Ooceraea biroi TaxID=2015173 RepID=UPI000F0749C4|nr:odorant receptor 22c-like isoform X2 [Ooceraea biroi]
MICHNATYYHDQNVVMDATRLRKLIKYADGGRRVTRNLCKSASAKLQQPSIEMDIFDNKYYGLTRQLMASIGLWPYQKREHQIVQSLCVSFILILSILLQVKSLFDQIQRDWKLIKNADELKIMQQYAYNAKFYTIFSGSIVYPGTLAFILTMFVPDVLDIITPLDEPRPRQLPVQIEFFFDQDRYFYLFSFIFIIVAFLGMTVLMATENMYMLFTQHACGLFKLLSHRLTRTFDMCSSKITPSKTKCRVCTNLLSVINIHQHCLKFLYDMQYKFSSSYFILSGFGVASLSVNMFRLFLALNADNVFESVSSGLFVYAHFCYIFWMNYFGQDLIDHGEYLLQQICNAQWYTAPLHSQKLLLMVLRRSMKSTAIIVGGLFIPSLEGFATLISMSLSYCMVIYSVRT